MKTKNQSAKSDPFVEEVQNLIKKEYGDAKFLLCVDVTDSITTIIHSSGDEYKDVIDFISKRDWME